MVVPLVLFAHETRGYIQTAHRQHGLHLAPFFSQKQTTNKTEQNRSKQMKFITASTTILALVFATAHAATPQCEEFVSPNGGTTKVCGTVSLQTFSQDYKVLHTLTNTTKTSTTICDFTSNTGIGT